MIVEHEIRRKLEAAFAPAVLVVENESAKHAGHAGVRDLDATAKGETHFRVAIVSSAFGGKSLVERHRAVNAILKDELAGPVHALAIKAYTPEEHTAGKSS